jgi:hypothetical protein
MTTFSPPGPIPENYRQYIKTTMYLPDSVIIRLRVETAFGPVLLTNFIIKSGMFVP